MGYRSPIFKSAWLWLMIIGIILILIAAIIRLASKKTTTAFWIVLLAGLFFFVLAIVLLIFWIRQPNKNTEVKKMAKAQEAATIR
jgi:uncharacterized membrane protein HdeD (DUF308 family)